MAKPTTTYAAPTKPKTTYSVNNQLTDSWLLNSSTVTLGSAVYQLNGLTNGQVLNQLNNKLATAYKAA